MKVTVLGTEYTIRRVDKGQDEYMEKMGFAGYCDNNNKEIVVLNYGSTPEWKDEKDAAIKAKEDETLRHEIIHAFLNESGLGWDSFAYDKAWSKNEEMIDWFAIQFPKINKVFEELKII